MELFLKSFLMASFTMSAVILLLLLLNKWLTYKVPAAFRYYMWLIVLIGLLIPFRPDIPIPFEPFTWTAPFGAVDRIGSAAWTSELQNADPGVVPAQSIVATDVAVDATAPEMISAAPVTEQPAALPFHFNWVGIWIAGVFAILVFHLWSYGKFVSVIRRWGAQPKDSRIYLVMQTVQSELGLQDKKIVVKECALLSSPMLIGFFNPTILLPEKPISSDELDYIFRHELTHYKHGDLFINLLVLLVSAIHWFNPLVHLMAKAIRADCEVACDAEVVAGNGADTRRRYGETILGFVGTRNTRNPVLSTYFYGGSNNMKKRLMTIMDTGKKSKRVALISVALVVLVTVFSGSVIAAPWNQGNTSAQYIGEARAKTIALQHAGITEQQATFIRAYLDYDDRSVVYDVEFYSGNVEYDYEIDAVSGAIREFDRDVEYYSIPVTAASAPSNPAQYIGEARAKTIALNHAGLTEAQANFITAYLDYDDGQVVYDIEFYSGNTEYDYEIDAVNGTIFGYDQDIEYYSIPGSSPTASGSAGNYIGEAKAKSIALTHAGVAETAATFLKVHLDSDDRVVVYDIEFYNGNTEYDYEVDAVSGTIREYDREIEYYTPATGGSAVTQQPAVSGNANAGQYIGEARAKTIAIGSAGITESQVRRMQVKLDREDGAIVYEVEFRSGQMEYEYEIDAVSGAIRNADVEYDD